MEDIDGGLHPAVDGQSLDEDEDEEWLVLICGNVSDLGVTNGFDLW